MADAPRRIVVTSAASPVGRNIVAALGTCPDVEYVRGVDSKANGEDIDIIPLVPDPRPFGEYLEKERFDTVVHCGLAPDRNGSSDRACEADVITTMCLGAAITHEGSPVRSWVIASSSAIYSIGSHSALMQTETQQLPREEETIAASIAEAEEYARDVAQRMPHINVAILRLQELAGTEGRGPLARLLGRDPVPVLIGFDPAIQLLHLDDAVSALAAAARGEFAGIYNVASAGLIHWHDAVRATGHDRVPVLPLSLGMLEPLFERVGIPFAPSDLFDLMRFGHVVDIGKIERAGWTPQHDQIQCLSQLSQLSSQSRPAGE